MVKEIPNCPTSEVKKMKQGMSYSGKEKTIIMNVFKYFRKEYPEQNVTEIVRRTSQATGCSEKSVFSFRKEENSCRGFKEPSKTKTRKLVNANSRMIKYDEKTRGYIKKAIYELKSSNIVPSLNAILKDINKNEDVPKFSLMTLRRLLSDMGFYYEKNGNKSVLVEREVPLVGAQAVATKENVVPSIATPITTSEADCVEKSTIIRTNGDNSYLYPSNHLGIREMSARKQVVGHSYVGGTLNSNGLPHIPAMLAPPVPPYFHAMHTPYCHGNKEGYIKEAHNIVPYPSTGIVHNGLL